MKTSEMTVGTYLGTIFKKPLRFTYMQQNMTLMKLLDVSTDWQKKGLLGEQNQSKIMNQVK